VRFDALTPTLSHRERGKPGRLSLFRKNALNGPLSLEGEG